ncbi:unnamed protein product [Symbiodinium sp. CCMP2592]|nr:unnamed protein product [Symbiodinium sp. CCMP2592]
MAAHPAISSVLFALGQKVRTSNVGGVISKADLLDVIVVFCDSEASASNAVQRTREVVQRRVNRWLKTNSPERAGYLHIVDGLRAPLSVEYFGPDVVVEVLRHFGAVITDESRGDFVHRMQGSDSATGEDMAIHLDPHPAPACPNAPISRMGSMESEGAARTGRDDDDAESGAAAAAAASSGTDAVAMFDPEFHPVPAGPAVAAAEGEAAEDNVMLHEKNCTQFREDSLAKDGRAKGQRQQHESNTLPDYLRAKQKLAITRTGAGEDAPGRYLTVPSTVALALRRNLSNVSCADLGLVILDDASRWSVSRSEVRAGAAATASMREWHAGMLQEMFHPDGAEDFNLSLHIVSQDATNSGIWQKRKLIALLCHSAYLVSLPSKFRWSWHDMFREIRAIADVQPVEDGSGQGSVSMTTKMLKSINCPTVHDLVAKHAELKADGQQRQQHQPSDEKPADADAKFLCVEWRADDSVQWPVHVYVFVTDRGPNEVLARKIWQCVSSACEHVVVLGSDCLEHAAHLVTVSSLKLVDKLLPLQFEGKGRAWKYFSSLATFSITVRDSSKDFFQMWCQEHGDLSGVKHAKSLWPKCVAGRWNSCSDVERRMHDSGGQATVLPVMRRLMGAKREAAPAKEHQSIDEIAVEETAHYTQQMGRWRATTLKCVEDPLWWTVAEAMRMARSPALHLSVPRGLQSAACIVTLCGL